jgi:hypothetical protein
VAQAFSAEGPESQWLAPQFGDGARLVIDTVRIDALSSDRVALWERASRADFLTLNEKREGSRAATGRLTVAPSAAAPITGNVSGGAADAPVQPARRGRTGVLSSRAGRNQAFAAIGKGGVTHPPSLCPACGERSPRHCVSEAGAGEGASPRRRAARTRGTPPHPNPLPARANACKISEAPSCCDAEVRRELSAQPSVAKTRGPVARKRHPGRGRPPHLADAGCHRRFHGRCPPRGRAYGVHSAGCALDCARREVARWRNLPVHPDRNIGNFRAFG